MELFVEFFNGRPFVSLGQIQPLLDEQAAVTEKSAFDSGVAVGKKQAEFQRLPIATQDAIKQHKVDMQESILGEQATCAACAEFAAQSVRGPAIDNNAYLQNLNIRQQAASGYDNCDTLTSR